MKKNLLIVLFAASIYSQAQVNLSSGLSACYSLNGSASEPINGLAGIVYSVTPANDRNNSPGSALEFAGTAASYIELPNHPLLQSTVAVSFSGWVYINAVQSEDFLVFTRNNASSSFAAYCLMASGWAGNKFRVYKESGTPNFAESTTQFLLNTWYHVAFTIDNIALKIYVNGVLEQTVASTTAFDYNISGKTVILGGSNELSYNVPFNGRMDNVRFYDRVLNGSEMLALYQQDPTCIDETVGIDEMDTDKSFKIFPNPANDILYLDLKSNESKNINVYSSLGQLVKNFPVSEGANHFPIEDLAAGIYLIVLDGASQNKTFVKN